MNMKPMDAAVFLAFGAMKIGVSGSYRMMLFKRRSDAKEAYATVGPEIWGRWQQ